MNSSSMLPFQDLNICPVPASTSTFTPLTPKLEPKLEPVDETTFHLSTTHNNGVQLPFSDNNNGAQLPFFDNNSGVQLPFSDNNNGVELPFSDNNGVQLPFSDNNNNGVQLPFPDNNNGTQFQYNRLEDRFSNAMPEGQSDDVSTYPDPNSLALTLVPPAPESHLSSVILSPRGGSRKSQARSPELVRIADLNPEETRYFRDLVRSTRMLFDSLRVFAIANDEKHRDPMLPHRRMRADLKAAQMLRERGLWLNRDKRVVGNIAGVQIGDVFFFRMELCVIGLHGMPQAGIDYVPSSQSSNGEPIATSIIVSGGYEDDEDAGDVIVYTGHGGQDKNNRQVAHQKLENGNLALERSMCYGIEVRVIRGFKYQGSASGKVYVYDGLYRIIETWFDVGKSGFGVYKFKLVRIENQVEMGSTVMKFAAMSRTRPLEAKPIGYVTLDLSRKKENFPVFFFNNVDNNHDPIYYEYLRTTIFPPYVYSSGSSTGCDCVDGCIDNCLCAMKNGGEFAYDLNGILVRGKPLVFECGPHCRCPITCHNRVTQKGVKNRFEVYRSTESGWALRSLDLIQAGSFICEYVGVVLTREQAQIFTMNGDNLIYPGRFADRWKEWGDLSQIYSDYVCPSYPSSPPLDFAMDISKMRNLACYMGHDSSPNVLVQFVLYDHNNVSFPHIMLFAMENIPPMRELTVDYGVADELTGKLAICN